MYKKLLITFLIGLYGHLSFGQNYIYRGTSKFESTPSYDFACGSCPMGGGTLKVSIARTDAGGLLLLTTSTPFSHERIAGTVLVYLADGSIITCTDKGVKDRLDGNSMALYAFTAAEMEQLMASNVYKIRFSIRDYMMNSSENLSAVNEEDYSYDHEPKYDVAQDVAGLYGQVGSSETESSEPASDEAEND
ncbi:hypothetical protein ACFPAF_04295 [Hymenobacter endophyticus]|uniref:Uncharacterized protein n=1 Tax=Hymenobacter endophyticus TaxID=3076335 RepID=A0ABU3TE40_9BACT|nr:hypothetical protein [Hymenobacter endophyticus]MDU0369605.1 hypothetical protein [Hymenobacter endophyticus]